MSPALLLLLTTSCGFADYVERPLDPVSLFEDVVTARRARAHQGDDDFPAAPLTLEHCVAWLGEGSPDFAVALADWHTTTASADVETPLPNPNLSAGVLLGSGSGLNGNDTAPLVGLGVGIPLSDRRARRDNLAEARSHRAGIEVRATWREQWLALRAELAGLSVSRQRTAARRALVEVNGAAVASVTRLIDAGVADAADVSAFRLALAQSEAAQIADRAQAIDLEHRIARRTGVNRDSIAARGAPRPPTIPAALPSREALRQTAQQSHPDLLRAEADYGVADRNYALAIEQQMPDLRFNPTFGAEVGESFHILGLALGLALPIFDRNQRQIALTKGARDAAYTRYASTASRVLADVDRAISAIELSQRRMQLFTDGIEALADETLSLSRSGVNAGAIGVRRYIDALRVVQTARIQAVSAHAATLQAWSQLETAVGAPLLRFDEPEDARPDTEPTPPLQQQALRQPATRSAMTSPPAATSPSPDARARSTTESTR